MIEFSCGILSAVGIYLLLSINPIQKIFGIALFSAVINMVIFMCGKATKNSPAFVNVVPFDQLSNPLTQALILTAIVISFGLLAFICVLVKYYLKISESA